jgi:hypothetical protein
MNNYIDHLLTNQSYIIDSVNSSEYSEHNNIEQKQKITKKIKKNTKLQKGGKDKKQNITLLLDNVDEKIPYIPHGGFPPIYICDKVKEKETDKKEREYSTHKTSISISDLMKARRDVNIKI